GLLDVGVVALLGGFDDDRDEIVRQEGVIRGEARDLAEALGRQLLLGLENVDDLLPPEDLAVAGVGPVRSGLVVPVGEVAPLGIDLLRPLLDGQDAVPLHPAAAVLREARVVAGLAYRMGAAEPEADVAVPR